MAEIILIVGLCVTVAGIVLSWYKKVQGMWATYFFGFLLVLTGGPLSNSISKFAVSPQGGLEVAFVQAKADTLSISPEGAVATLQLQTTNISSEIKKELPNEANIDVAEIKQLTDYVKQLGMTPIKISSSESYKPGTIVRIYNGQLDRWASPEEAFPELLTSSSSVSIPNFELEGNFSSDKSSNFKTRIQFSCKNGANIVSATDFGLTSKINKKVLNHFGDNNLYVVQGTLLCNNLEMSTEGVGKATVVSPVLKKLIDAGVSGEVKYESTYTGNVALGYKFSKIVTGNVRQP